MLQKQSTTLYRTLERLLALVHLYDDGANIPPLKTSIHSLLPQLYNQLHTEDDIRVVLRMLDGSDLAKLNLIEGQGFLNQFIERLKAINHFTCLNSYNNWERP